MLRPAVAAVLLAAAAALAGCAGAGGAGKGPTATANFKELGLQATATTGVIRGVVVDDAVRPLAGVHVTARGPGAAEAATNTSADGVFGFSGLAPGSYFLRASKPGYREVQQSADVAAGVAEPAPVKILLAVDPANRPYYEAYAFDGFLQCGVTAIVTQVAVCLAPNLVHPGTLEEKTQVTYNLTGRPQWVQTEMTWEPTQAAGNDLTLEYSWEGGCGLFCDHQVNGTSPLLLQANQTVIDTIGLGNHSGLYVRVFSDDVDATQPPVNECTPVPDPVLGAIYCTRYGVGATLQQRFEHYTHVFYGYAPPPAWRFSSGDPVPLPPS